MNIECLKRVGKWLLNKLADAIVHLGDLLLRFLLLVGLPPTLKVRKDKLNY